MKLHILFGQQRCRYEGEYAPTAYVCWDEFCVDENPDGFLEACEDAKKKWGGADVVAWRVIVVQVDGDRIAKLLNEAPVVPGVVDPG